MNSKSKSFTIISILFVILICFTNKKSKKTNFNVIKINQTFYFNDKFITKKEINLTRENCEKWIILSTNNYPNDQIKYLKDSSYGWCFLVVAQNKTLLKWEYKDIYYLDIKEQNEFLKKFKLNYKFLSKIIGYLFLISKNAEFIYETNDNLQINDGLLNFKYELFSGIQLECNDSHLINPEIYFKNEEKNKECNSFSSVSLNKIPIIQQGIISSSNEFNFKSNFPSILLKTNQYANLKSENTFYHYDSLWSVMIPPESSEIIRSFITIRLINEIEDGKVAFLDNNAQLLSINQEENGIKTKFKI